MVKQTTLFMYIKLSEILKSTHSSTRLKYMKNYNISIYDAGGDITKSWYVRWYYRDSETCKMVRQTNIKDGCNRIKNKADRYAYLKDVMELLKHSLDNGFDPNKAKLKITNSTKPKTYSLDFLFEHFIEIREAENIILRNYKSIYTIFKKFLEEKEIDYSSWKIFSNCPCSSSESDPINPNQTDHLIPV